MTTAQRAWFSENAEEMAQYDRWVEGRVDPLEAFRQLAAGDKPEFQSEAANLPES